MSDSGQLFADFQQFISQEQDVREVRLISWVGHNDLEVCVSRKLEKLFENWTRQAGKY